jgi:SAM-dependent methyltransferase
MRIADDVLAVLSAAETDGNSLILVGQLDRKLYERTNKCLEAAGGKWNRKAKAHVFDGDAAERVDQMVLTGEVEIPKDEFNFFPTPPEVIAELLKIAEIEPGHRVLEPSAGDGAIVDAARAAGGFVYACELSEQRAIPLGARGLEWLAGMHVGDFLQLEPVRDFDCVVMNPPFAKRADIHHVLHAYKFLKPGGILVSVMSASVLFREDKLTRDFRAFVGERLGGIKKLPDGSFKVSGTMVNTVIVDIPA